jgi:hypothetical protein
MVAAAKRWRRRPRDGGGSQEMAAAAKRWGRRPRDGGGGQEVKVRVQGDQMMRVKVKR